MAANKLEIVAEPGKPVIVTRRVVNAPRALVFDTFIKPEHLKRWMGPRALAMVICECEPRASGRWRMVSRAPDGQEFGWVQIGRGGMSSHDSAVLGELTSGA